MSVTLFSADELAQVIACSHQSGSVASRDGRQELAGKLAVMAKISQANARAYNATYGEEARGCTAAQIENCLTRAFLHKDRATARSVITGMRYNLIANDGRDFADFEVLDGLNWFMRGLMGNTP